VRLQVQRLRPDAVLPGRAYAGDAGLDLVACEEVTLAPGERAAVGTGLAVAIPEGHAGFVQPRSGLAVRHGITLVNTPGLIDAGYRGELIMAVVNLDRTQAVTITKGERIAQLVVVALPQVVPAWADTLPDSDRGAGGFGSTGTA